MPTSQFPDSSITGDLKVTGSVTAGSGAVEIVDGTGKMPALSSTYLANLDGSNLTGVAGGAMSLLHTNSGTNTSTSAVTLMSYPMASQLAATDGLVVYILLRSTGAANKGLETLFNSTDTVDIGSIIGTDVIPVNQRVNSLWWAWGASGISGDTGGAWINIENKAGTSYGPAGAAPAFTTAWTGAWTIAVKHGGMESGGTMNWQWYIYKVLGS